MNYKDPWAILGVDRTATDAEIKTAYRKLAKEFHPDAAKNKGNPEVAGRFQEISHAYSSISTDTARAEWLATNDSHSLFEESFPPFPDAPQAAAPSTYMREVEQEVSVSFREAFLGTNKDVIVEVEDVCGVCGGSGAAPGTTPRTCEVCNGTREHRVARLRNRCSACDGRGVKIDRPCRNCNHGMVTEARTFVLSVPPGVPDGYKMKLQGPQRGRFGSTHLLVTVRVSPSPVFERNLSDPADLMMNVPITYSEAVFGGQVKIPTPERTIGLMIPAATSSGKVFRIAGAGMPRLGEANRGDLYARVEIAVPEKVSGSHKRLIKQLQDHDPPDVRFPLFDKLSES